MWVQQAYLKASNTESGDRFGSSVALSGGTLAVAAPSEDSGAVGINGNQVDNGASSAGAVYVFDRGGESWMQQAYLKASNAEAGDGFGHSVALSGDALAIAAPYERSVAMGINGDQIDNSASNAGAVYAFSRSEESWTQQAYLKASNVDANDYFGWAVALSGNALVIGADYESSSATGINGDQADDSATFSGAIYIFH